MSGAITWRGKMRHDPRTKLWVTRTAEELALEAKTARWRRGMWRRGKKKTVYGPTGRPIAEVRVSDFGNTEHEYDDHQDAVARPDPVKLDFAEIADIVPGFGDVMSLDVARVRYDEARKQFARSPSDPEALAQWSRAKAELFAARQRARLDRNYY